MSWFEATRTRLRLLFARRRAESRMEAEFGFHLEMEAERLVREAGRNEGDRVVAIQNVATRGRVEGDARRSLWIQPTEALRSE